MSGMPDGYDKAQRQYDAQTPPEPSREDHLRDAHRFMVSAAVILERCGVSLDEAVGGNADDVLWRMYVSMVDSLDALTSIIDDRLERPDA